MLPIKEYIVVIIHNRINDVDIINEMFNLGYRIGHN